MSSILLRDVPNSLHRDIRIGAAIRGCTMSEFILEVVAEAKVMRRAAAMAEEAPSQGQEGEG